VLLPELDPPDEPFFASLARLEEHARASGERPPQSLMLAVLLAPLVRDVLGEATGGEVEVHIGDRMLPIVQRLVVARRDSGVARQCLAALARVARPPHGRGSKRFTQRPYFREAMVLREILGGVGFGASTFTTNVITLRIGRFDVAASLLLALVIGVGSGVGPAWRAARMRPIEALRRG
jgi:hypothetical protein